MAYQFKFPNMNPFAAFFKKARSESEETSDRQRVSNAQGLSQEDTAIQTVGSASVMGTVLSSQPGEATVTVTGIQFEQVFENKRQKVAKYREMSNYPDIEKATENLCDDAIIEDDDGKILTLNISKDLPENVRNLCQAHFKYLLDEVFSFNETGWDLFKRFLIDSELYGELVLNETGDNIIGIKLLPSYTMTPVYNSGVIQAYVQVPEKNFQNKKQIDFDHDQIVYINYGKFGENIGDVRGYYESAIKTYNQLKSMEDAVVVYRLVRSVERRAWNVYTGKMQKPQAEAYIKGLIQRFKKRMIYDPNTGAVNSAQNVIAMTEDYWFSTNAEGQGTKVETLPGGASLGELEDVRWFLKKLYMALKLPKSRWNDESPVISYGKTGEITQEEIHWAQFIERLQRKFKYFILDPFIVLLRMRGMEEKFLKRSYFNIQFTESNLFKEYKQMEILDARLSILNQFSNFLYSEENKGGIFAPKFVMRKYFKMSDADMAENDAEIAKISPPAPPAPETPEAGPEGPPEGEGEAGAEGGEKLPELPSLALPELPETPPAGAEAAPKKKMKRAKGFYSKFIPPNELHSPKAGKGFDLFSDWKRADTDLINRNKLPKDDIL